MPTLNELKLKLAEIDQALYASWLREREVARRHIAQLAVEFRLSPTTVAADIAAAQRRAPAQPDILRPPKVDLPLRSPGVAQHVAAKYRNAATGETWTGRGPRPQWLRNALDAGAVLEDFLLHRTEEPRTLDPLREFQDAARRGGLKQQR